jgi:hypothetical protein
MVNFLIVILLYFKRNVEKEIEESYSGRNFIDIIVLDGLL